MGIPKIKVGEVRRGYVGAESFSSLIGHTPVRIYGSIEQLKKNGVEYLPSGIVEVEYCIVEVKAIRHDVE
jgi:hypothetical protein